MRQIFEDFFDNIETEDVIKDYTEDSIDTNLIDYDYTFLFQWKDRNGQSESGLRLTLKDFRKLYNFIRYFNQTNTIYQASEPRIHVADLNRSDTQKEIIYPFKEDDFKAGFLVVSISFDFKSNMSLKKFYKFYRYFFTVIKPEATGIFKYKPTNKEMRNMDVLLFMQPGNDMMQDIHDARRFKAYSPVYISLLSPDAYFQYLHADDIWKHINWFFKADTNIKTYIEEQQTDITLNELIPVLDNDFLSRFGLAMPLYTYAKSENYFVWEEFSFLNSQMKEIVQKYGNDKLTIRVYKLPKYKNEYYMVIKNNFTISSEYGEMPVIVCLFFTEHPDIKNFIENRIISN